MSRQTPQKADNRTASIGGGQLEQMVNNGQTLDTLTPQEMAYLARQERNNGGVLPEDLYNAVYKNASDDIDEVVVTGYRTKADRDWYAANFNASGNYTGPHKDYFPTNKPAYQAPRIPDMGRVLTQFLGVTTLPASGAAGLVRVGGPLLLEKALLVNSAGITAAEIGAGVSLTAGTGTLALKGAKAATQYLDEAVNSPLMISANPATGNPAAIARGFGELSTRQASVLDALPEYGSSTIVHKSFGQKDLAALSAMTGDEFAMFTTGGRRLIYRGDASSVPITPEIASNLSSQGWRWSSHVHPDGNLMSSLGDRAVLGVFPNPRSTILDPYGNRGLFNANGDMISSSWLPTPKK